VEAKAKLMFYKDKAGKHRWRIVASNGRILGVSSEGYENKSDCETACLLCKNILKAYI